LATERDPSPSDSDSIIQIMIDRRERGIGSPNLDYGSGGESTSGTVTPKSLHHSTHANNSAAQPPYGITPGTHLVPESPLMSSIKDNLVAGH
jgi:hypothetical protein